MAECASLASPEIGNREKIKTPFARIIVNNSTENNYYHVMWWQDGEMQIGFGSQDLSFVRKWLSDEFEIDSPAADVVPVVHGRWVDGKCSNCGVDIPTDDAHDAIFENECHFCYYCGAMMDGGNS